MSFEPLEVIDYAFDTSSNVAIYHFIVDEENKEIRARAVAIGDPEGEFLIPIHDHLYYVSLPEELKKVRMSLYMQDKRNQFITLKILYKYDKDEE